MWLQVVHLLLADLVWLALVLVAVWTLPRSRNRVADLGTEPATAATLPPPGAAARSLE